ncbi:CHAT domain-containing protein [Aetokthonos hydrillicola Thurmond2011]|jgi:CHAT domain-containing protein|uniref:CHAT domain-containing protein n=1 Tax=Aetokthonos hydrillicola Thurmond2011 TaxID=2712845 RepID=A0AAP5IEY8_9CYAN|nr:CHAT domain-containing protein [Aetokthonos hydrillicola]MBO3463477.1 CHAT domain-containing protein [Aetokthonos hydrillicola CCALA 1050]MBW4590435.1 CHAT domain-containing protein [Aetokthonos hydrillicola CCALA 1050]MDR9899737.1 CHAT domain-containing protein [Aetokthonos hydrillicola Thurmond2011]
MFQDHLNLRMKYILANPNRKDNLQQIYQLLARNTDKEQVISCYQEALKTYTFEDFPEQWATTQNYLGVAYHKVGNLEQAICCYLSALKVYTRESFPEQWAITKYYLGDAYGVRITGDRSENLEQEIICYHDALKVYTFDTFPEQWANTKNNFSHAYRERIRGERAENLEQAITCCYDALKIYTFDAFPEKWAMTKYSLSNAYRERIRGERAENLEQAITCCYDALKIYTFDAFPKEWATTKNHLGLTYIERIRGERVENLEQAITCYQEALKIYTFDAFPKEWAMVQINLGKAYGQRITGDLAENLEQAISYSQEALKVYTFDAFPEKWAMVQNNLGIFSRRLTTLRNIGNFQKTIDYYLSALTVHTRENFPEYWAMTQVNIGAVYLSQYRINKERTEDLKAAIDCYLSASKEVFTREAFPQKYAEVQDNLGKAYKENQQFSEAYTAFAAAIDIIESFRQEILYGSAIDDDKKKLAEEWNQLYQSIVEVCLDLAKNEPLYYVRAIEYIERSKTRNLVELILDRDLKTIFPSEVADQLEQLRDKIASGQYEIQNNTAENPKLLAQNLQQLRQQRQELQDRYLPVGSGFRFDKFQPTLAQHTAIIEWYITNQKILAFVVKPNGQELTVWESQPEDLECLSNWENEYLQDYYTRKNQWQNQLEKRLKQLSKILHIESILEQIPAHCDRLILIPHRFLHLLPLHALPVGESYLVDKFPLGVAYAPSCQLLQQVQQRQRPDFQSLFAIQNPTGDLQFTDQEVNSILSLFPSHQVLSNSHATKAAIDQAVPHLQEVDYLHFSCHGHFKTDSPLDSFLLLADAKVSSIPMNADPKQYFETSKGIIDLSKCLTLGNLFERGFDFKKCRLVVLSACETGLIDFNNNSDEYIGLPSGFLYAGSSSVVSSLWTVDDMSTAYLMIKFLQNLKAAFDGGEDVSVAVALNQAQHWLRNITWKDLEEWANHLQLDSSNHPEAERSMRQMREILAKNPRRKNIDEKLFQSPYHWAGFTAIGK